MSAQDEKAALIALYLSGAIRTKGQKEQDKLIGVNELERDPPRDVPERPCCRCGILFQPTRKRWITCLRCWEMDRDAGPAMFGF